MAVNVSRPRLLLENPRVGGSIPPLATTRSNRWRKSSAGIQGAQKWLPRPPASGGLTLPREAGQFMPELMPCIVPLLSHRPLALHFLHPSAGL